MINHEWEPQKNLEPTDIRLILESYVTAREKYSGHEKSLFTNLVDEFTTIWRTVTSQEQEMVVATSSAATPASSVAFTTLSTTPADISKSWPPAHFAPEERRLFSDVRLLDDLHGIDNSNTELPPVPTNISHPLTIQVFLSTLALSCFPKTHRFGLYVRPIAFVNYKAKKHAVDTTCGTVGGFVKYAHDMLYLHNRAMVIGLVMFLNRRCPRVVVIHRMHLVDDKCPESDLRFLCFDPMNRMFNNLGNALTERVNGVFGHKIKEAWWGGWTASGVSHYHDLIDWTCSWILRLIYDESQLPKHDMEWKGYTNVIGLFDSSRNVSSQPLIEGGAEQQSQGDGNGEQEAKSQGGGPGS
ncbi:hypothetical protein GGR53DRAFT_505681 [Hypoxylon sp. FL1150]|nr:hypothetical protein GGR53DRAFT_505681 [Hypoxylon sp. FL1150]